MRSRFPVFISLLVALATASAAHANPYTVTTTADTHHSAELGGVCDTPCSLRGAVETAQANPGNDTITVPAGHYVLTHISGSGDPSVLNLASDEAGGALTIVGAGAGQTVVDANGTDRAFVIQATEIASISHLEVTGGIAAEANGGGGGDIDNVGTLSLDHVWLTGGSGFRGGAIANRGLGNLAITNSLISGNKAGDHAGDGVGGAIINDGDTALARMKVINTTITANQQLVAAIETTGDFGAQTNLDHDTVAFNQSLPLGGSDAQGTGGVRDSLDTTTTTVTGSIVFGNTATFLTPTVVPQNCGTPAGGQIISAGGNVGPTECNFTLASDRPDADPLLAALANNGGETQTLALGAGSPAIDLGGAAACPATDQRDHARPQGAACDAGAYEADVTVTPPPTTTTTTTAPPPPPPPPPAQPEPGTVITGSILYDPAFAPGPPPAPVSPSGAPGHPSNADVELLDSHGGVVAHQHVSLTPAAGAKLGVATKSPVSQLAGTSPSFELDKVAPCAGCTLELLSGKTLEDSAPLDVTADDTEIDQNLTYGQIPDGQFAEGSIVAPKGVNVHNFVVQIFAAGAKTPLASTEKLPVACAPAATAKSCTTSALPNNGSIRWRLGGLKGKGTLTAKLLQKNSKGKLIEIDTVHAKLAQVPQDTEFPALTTIDIDPSGPAGRVLDGVIDYHPAFAPGAPDTAGEDMSSVPKPPKLTVELDDAHGRKVATTNATATATTKATGTAKGAKGGPTSYRFTHLDPCARCTVRLLAGSTVQDSVKVDVTGDDPSIQRQDLEFDRIPGGTWVDGTVNVPRGLSPTSISVQVLQGTKVLVDSAKLASSCSGKAAGGKASAKCAATKGAALPYRLGTIPPNLKNLTLVLLWQPKGGKPFAVDSQRLDSGDPGSAAEASPMTIPDPQPTGPVGRILTGAVTIDAPFAPGAPPDATGITIKGLTVELHAASNAPGLDPSNLSSLGPRLASGEVTTASATGAGAGAGAGAKNPTSVTMSYALTRLDSCLSGCVVVLLKGRTVEDSAPVIVPTATPSVTVAPLADNHLPSGPHLIGTLSFAKSRSPVGLSVRVTAGKTVVADSSKLRGCTTASSCPSDTHFDFRLARLPINGGKVMLSVQGSSAGAKGSGASKTLLTKTITLASGGADTNLGTIKVP